MRSAARPEVVGIAAPRLQETCRARCLLHRHKTRTQPRGGNMQSLPSAQKLSLRRKDVACLDVEALFIGFTHAEGLARQRADLMNCLKEACLVKLRQQQADCMPSLHSLVHRLLAMHVADVHLWMRFDKLIHRIGHGDNWQKLLWRDESEFALRPDDDRVKGCG